MVLEQESSKGFQATLTISSDSGLVPCVRAPEGVNGWWHRGEAHVSDHWCVSEMKKTHGGCQKKLVLGSPCCGEDWGQDGLSSFSYYPQGETDSLTLYVFPHPMTTYTGFSLNGVTEKTWTFGVKHMWISTWSLQSCSFFVFVSKEEIQQ